MPLSIHQQTYIVTLLCNVCDLFQLPTTNFTLGYANKNKDKYPDLLWSLSDIYIHSYEVQQNTLSKMHSSVTKLKRAKSRKRTKVDSAHKKQTVKYYIKWLKMKWIRIQRSTLTWYNIFSIRQRGTLDDLRTATSTRGITGAQTEVVGGGAAQVLYQQHQHARCIGGDLCRTAVFYRILGHDRLLECERTNYTQKL